MLNLITKEINKNLLKWAAGQQMFCPSCDRILDWKTTAIVESKQGDKIAATFTCCTKCLDRKYGHLYKAIEKVNKMEGKNITLEVTRA